MSPTRYVLQTVHASGVRLQADQRLVYDSAIQIVLHSDALCCHMGTAMKHLVPNRVKPSFVIFDIRAL